MGSRHHSWRCSQVRRRYHSRGSRPSSPPSVQEGPPDTAHDAHSGEVNRAPARLRTGRCCAAPEASDVER
eukprot:4520113-Heterocapsa_arctica.AAC.1